MSATIPLMYAQDDCELGGKESIEVRELCGKKINVCFVTMALGNSFMRHCYQTASKMLLKFQCVPT